MYITISHVPIQINNSKRTTFYNKVICNAESSVSFEHYSNNFLLYCQNSAQVFISPE